MIVCSVCGKEFVPVRRSKFGLGFCSISCYKKHWYLEKTKNDKNTCKICGSEFHPCQKFRTYCSVECMKEGRRRHRKVYRTREYNRPGHAPVELGERVCAFCGNTFTQKKPNQRFCCKKCQKTADNQSRNSSRAAARVIVKKTCVWCGSEFETTRLSKNTCSLNCSYSYNKHKCSSAEFEERQQAKREKAVRRAAEKALRFRVNGLTDAQMRAVAEAQDGDPSLLWKLSQNWTQAMHKYAKARYESIHGLWTQTFYG